MQINFRATLLAALAFAPAARAARIEVAPVAPAPAALAPVVAPVAALTLTPALSASPVAPSILAAPLAAPAAAAAGAMTAPALRPTAAPSTPENAKGQVEKAAQAIAKPGADAVRELAKAYDGRSGKLSQDEVDAILGFEPVGTAHGSGLKKAARPAAARHEYKSPEGAEARELTRLTASLSENRLPSYKTATVATPVDERRPTVVILSPASRHKVAIAREGGKQAPGDVHLALDASWLIQETGPDGKNRLLLKKGVTFDANGQATVVEYKVPRVVRYFANYFTLGANDRDDGVPFEKDLDVPQSNSLKLEGIVNDKLRMSLVGAANGVEVPAMLTFAMPKHPLAASSEGATAGDGRVSVTAMPQGPAKADSIRRRVDAFLDRYEGGEIVVKPSGPQFHSGRGVKFFKKEQRAEIAAHALALSSDPMMTRDGAVIVTGRVDSAPLERGGRKMETTLRVLAARTPWGGAKTTDIFARVGPWGKPTTAEAADPRDNATVEPWERLLADWKLTPEQARRLDARVRAMGATMLQAIMKTERGLRRAPGEPYRAQTDLIGLDVMIEKRGRELVPVMIEVNDHDSGGQYNLDAEMATERVGTHSREWVATMLQRARRDALRGRRVALVGAGYAGKRFIFERARELGVKIVLVDSAKSPFVQELKRDGLIDRLIDVDNAKPEAARARALKKLLASAKKDGEIGGVTTFWEDDVPLAAALAADLGLPYHTRAAAEAVRSKAKTRDVLEAAGLPTPRHRRVRNLNSAKDSQERARVLEDFLASADHVGYPAVLKPVFGAAAMGVKRVNSRAEALAAFEEMGRVVTPETDAIFAQGTDMVLEQYLDGREWDVDLVMRGGKAVFSSLTDNKPTREPYFLATGSMLPSVLPESRQAESVDLAIRSAQALGLKDGVIHVEGKDTSEGPRLIEANGRMGGEYVRDWVRDVWGVDLVEENLMVAAGVPGTPFKPIKPLVYLDGDFVIPTKSGVIERFGVPVEARDNPGFHELRVKKKVGDRIAVPPDGYERAGMLVARGASRAEAERNLKALEASLLLDIK